MSPSHGLLPNRDRVGEAPRADRPLHTMSDVRAWLAERQAAMPVRVTRVPLRAMTEWSFDSRSGPLRIVHRSGRFFAVEGVRVTTDFGPVPQWDQPILVQPEVGTLGIVTHVLNGTPHFLLQAKVEPGNVTGVQLAPTVQATRSNYTRVHGGADTTFLEYFRGHARARVLVDQLQSEQASRYLRKQNRNMIVEVHDELPHDDRFRWLTLAQIKALLREPNVINMDTRTVLACLTGPDVAPAAEHATRHDLRELLHWLTDLRASHSLTLERRAIDELDHWVLDDAAVHHESGRYFSVIGVAVEAGCREIRHWEQPLLEHPGFGLNGFIVKRFKGVRHLLVRACMYPGNHALFELGSTVSRSSADFYFGRPDAPAYLELFHDPPASWIRYSAIQSEEGGRFYHYQNRYVILELPDEIDLPESPVHRWMALAQVQELLPHGYINIEARNLLACLDQEYGDAD